MNFKNHKNDIQAHLGKGEVTLAIDLLLTYLQKSHNDKYYNQALLIKSKWVNTEQEYLRIGSISKSEYDISFSKTIYAIQEIMNDLSDAKPTNFPISRVNNFAISKIYILGFIIISLFVAGLYYWKQTKKSINTETALPSELHTKPSNSIPLSDKNNLQNNKPSVIANTPTPVQAVQETKKSNVETKIIGVNFLDDNGENDNELSEKIIKTLKETGQSFAIADKYQIKNYAKIVISQLTINKISEKEILKTKVSSYDVKLVIQCVDVVTNKPCAERKFNTIVEANEFDSKEKIKSQGFSEILEKIKLDNNFFKCN